MPANKTETGPNICTGGVPLVLGGNDGGVILPLLGEWEADWPTGVKVLLYMLGLFWCFLGVSIIADIFMTAIEKITSAKKRVMRQGKLVTVKVWNDTVANLTLMALGSSAPEILLSLIELVLTEKWNSGSLGPSTIVGSAAFNLLCITAVCVSALPPKETRIIKDQGVFAVTATFSIFAYLWLLFILLGPSPNVVDVWEGMLTFLFFPILVLIAYLVDIGYFARIFNKVNNRPLVLTATTTPEECEQMMKELEVKYGRLPDKQYDQNALMYYEYAPPVSRAARRVQATRSMMGGAQVFDTMARWVRGKAVAAELMAESLHNGYVDAVISFVSSHYAVAESEGKVTLTVSCKRKGAHKDTVKVHYDTLSGTADVKDDFCRAHGTLTFGPSDEYKSFEVKIINDNQQEDTEYFTAELKLAKESKAKASLGENWKAKVVIIDSNGPGLLKFQEETLRIESTSKMKFNVPVKRVNGAAGKVSCQYRTEDASAKAGADYTSATGTLNFDDGATNASFTLEVMARTKTDGAEEEFRVILDEPTKGVSFDPETDGGKESSILTVKLVAGPGRTRWENAIAEVDWDAVNIGTSRWKDKFIEAIYVGGSKQDQKEATPLDWTLHLASVPWKLLFACVPPTDYCGGWLCFFCSLGMIGLLTAVIGDMANLLGCAMNMKAAICAVTFVALGTSLPDTFASKTAAVSDASADNSIGNVTGSNSVNVFLGLGLPWMMGAIYWKINGKEKKADWDARGLEMNWFETAPELAIDYPEGAFVVIGGNLGISVGVFCVCAMTAIGLLCLRRWKLGAELGGDKKIAYASSAFLVCLWLIYIAMAIVAEGGVSPY